MEKLGNIGVFDSGLGGLWILKYLTKELPDYHFIYFADQANGITWLQWKDGTLTLPSVALAEQQLALEVNRAVVYAMFGEAQIQAALETAQQRSPLAPSESQRVHVRSLLNESDIQSLGLWDWAHT